MNPALLFSALLAAGSVAPTPIALPGGEGGIGFDDLRFSSELHAIIVPAGRTGSVDLVDPATGAVQPIPGFSRAASPARGHGQGTTSADTGQGYLFAIDRTRRTVGAVDAGRKRIVAESKLRGAPDYVRWVGGAQEVWVTEPASGSIEIFSFAGGERPALSRAATIPVPGGPESLVVEPSGRRAYTNTFGDETFAIDVASRTIAGRWANRCRGARGIELDATRGILFVGCDEGTAVSLDAAHPGTRLGEARTGKGVDGIAYGAALSHLYVPAADVASLTVLAVGSRGELSVLGTIPAPAGAHCAVADDRGNVYVCDPRGGRLLVLHDPYPASR